MMRTVLFSLALLACGCCGNATNYQVGEEVLVTWMFPAEPQYSGKILRFSKNNVYVEVTGQFGSPQWEKTSSIRKIKDGDIEKAMGR